ncbi:hypothetical protein LCGC14_2642550, partial [marine sediment metagenome]
MKRKTLDDARLVAISKGGLCLSDVYINSKTKLKWICSEGHIWKTIFSHIKDGRWCPFCSNVAKNTLKDAQKLA